MMTFSWNNVDWNEAPEWANYAAMDCNGQWHWFSDKPVLVPAGYWWKGLNVSTREMTPQPAYTVSRDCWKSTLQERPKITSNTVKHVMNDIDWGKAPVWANYAAMDKDGNWCWYRHKPEPIFADGYWDARGAEDDMIPNPSHLINYLPWMDSLLERPKDPNKKEESVMKNIDWNKAPEWANYAAMDADGEWYWYGCKPEPDGVSCWGTEDIMWEKAPSLAHLPAARSLWESTLQKRPKNTSSSRVVEGDATQVWVGHEDCYSMQKPIDKDWCDFRRGIKKDVLSLIRESNMKEHNGRKKMNKNEAFKQGLRDLLNTYSVEEESDTPDFVLAEYLFECLESYESAVQKR